MRRTVFLLALCVVCASLLSVALAAGEAKAFSISWSDKTVTEMLSTLGRTFGLNYVLPSGLGQTRLSVNLIQTTPDRALQTIVSKAGLRAEKRGGTWYVSQGANQGTSNGTEFAQMGMPGFGGPMGGPMGGMGGMGGMMGARGGFGGANPAVAGDLGAPGGIGGFGAPPGRGQQTNQATGQQGGLGVTTTRQLSFVVLPIFYASPSVLGQALGFDSEIWDDGSSSGGGGGGYGNGNNGGGGRGGGNSGGRGGGGNSNRGGGNNSNRGGNNNNNNSNRNY